MTILTAGLSATIEQTVTPEQLAGHVGSGSAPVFATPELALLVEKAAVAALDGALQVGETSVGTELNLSHLAATPLGMRVTATVELTAVDGRKLQFDVSARDEVDEICTGTHTRFVVDAAKFVARANAKTVT